MSESLSPDDADVVTAEIVAVSLAGIPLSAGLRAAANELTYARPARVLRELAVRLERGESLGQAARAEGSLPAFIRGVIQAADEAGRTDAILPTFLDQWEQQREQTRRFRQALAYPAFVVLTAIVLYGIAATWCVPPVAELLDDLQVKAAYSMRILVWWSRYGIYGVLVVGGTLLTLALLLRLIAGAEWWDRWMSKVPLIGPPRRWGAESRMSHWMAMLLDMSLPTPDALRLTAMGVGDANVASACRAMAADVERGASLSRSLDESKRLSHILVPLCESGEAVDGLADSFRQAARMFDRWCEYRLRLVRYFLPPLALLIVAGMALNLYMALSVSSLMEAINALAFVF